MENRRSRLENTPDAYRLTSLNHALDVLEFLASCDGPVAVTDVAKATSLVKSGAYRLLHNLEQRGYVRKNGESRYVLGVGIWRLASALTQVSSLRERARPLLVAVTAATKETTHLAVLDRMYSVYIDKAETSASIRAYAEIGDRAPAHAVATGKVLLSCLAPGELNVLLDEPLERYTSATNVDPDALRVELDRIRADGFAVNDGEWRDEVVGVAVPVRIHDGCTVALGVAGPRYRFPADLARSHLPLLRTKAKELETWLVSA